MKIQLVTGETTFQAGINTIKEIDAKDRTFQNLVVVPDAFSMQAEGLIFDTLKISATFNIEVVGISRLASKILRDNGVDFKRISNLEEIFCIFKAVKSCEDKFEYFKSCKMELCQKILLVVKQFKACKIQPEKINSVGDENLDKKMHDLRIVYEEYEKLLQEKLDLSKLLEFFLENAENLQNLSKINLFFCNFDSFTTEINDFIVRLAKHVNSVHIGISQALSPLNAHIFEDDIQRKTTALSKAENEFVEVKKSQPNLSGPRLEIVENVFGLDFGEKKIGKNSENLQNNEEKTQKNDENSTYFLNVVAKNPRDEVEYLAKYIRFALFNGARQKDFAVAVSNEKYYDLIKEIFPSYGILTNSDDATTLSDTILGRFLLKMLAFSKIKLSSDTFKYLSASPLCGINEKAISEIDRRKIEDADEFTQSFSEYEKFINLLKMLKKCEKIGDFCDILGDFLKITEKSHEKFLEKMESEKFFKKHSENSQAKDLLEKTLEKIASCGKDEKISLEDFEVLVGLAFSSVKVETVPSYVDAVFVGNATDSYFEDVKNLFVLGCDELPRAQGDLGLVDDDEIKKLTIIFALEPEIRVLNRRNRLKIFELLQHATEKLVTITPFSRDGRVTRNPDFVADLKRIFGDNTTHTVALEDFDLPMFSKEENLENLLFFVGCNDNLLPSYTNLLSKDKLPRALASSLSGLIKSTIVAPKRVEYVDPKRLLPSKAFSSSRLETWFSCPFKHMVSYGLNVREKETIEPDARGHGSFVHEFLQKFLTDFDASKVTEEEAEKFLKDNVKPIAKKFFDEKIIKDRFFMKNLCDQSKIILNNVIKEQKYSNFRPVALEKEVTMKIGKWNLYGRVDRVDECENYFRIIDFKTGKTNSIKTELYYGKKLQLFLYAKAVQNQTDKVLAGTYYFVAKSRFTKANTPILRGVTRKDEKIVEMTDSSVEFFDRGVILGCGLRSKPKKGEFKYSYLGNEDLDELVQYAFKVSEKAMDEISTGYSLDKPFEGACKFCPYISICRHDKTRGYRKKLSDATGEDLEEE